MAILITCAPFAALGAATINPTAEWCDTGNVPGLYDSAQAVCTARQAYIGYPTLIYFPDPAAPSYAPYGSCSYWSESYHYWQPIGSASWGLVCPLGFQPINFAPTPGHCQQVAGTGYIGVWANPNGNMVCQRSDVDNYKNKGPCCDNTGSNDVGNPINSGTQTKHLTQVDLALPGMVGPLTFSRTYNSAKVAEVGSTSILPVPLMVGRHWASTYDTRLLLSPPSTLQTVWIVRPDGRALFFNGSGSQWLPDPDIADRLTATVDGSNNPTAWQYHVAANEDTETYDVYGHLVSIVSRSGATRSLTYNPQGQLTSVQDAFGRQLTVQFGANGLLSNLTDQAGNVTGYQYDSYGNLSEVDYPGGTSRHYLYENASLKNALTGITDENGARYATYSYDNNSGNATTTQLAGGANKWTVSATGQVTDPTGNVSNRTFSTVQGVVRLASSTAPCASCGSGNQQAVTYDSNGNASSRTDFNNKKICYAYDLTRNLETARVEGALSTEVCSTVLVTPPNRPDVRKVTTTWNASYRLPATIVEPASGGTKTTAFAYDGSGNLTQKSAVAPANDGSGNNITRTWNWTYSTYGRVLTATDPDNNTTTTTYYADNDADLGKRGNIATITNAAGHLTQITAYDANGRPLSITDPNGLVTTLTYHPRGWLTSRQVGAELTSYNHDGVGQLTKVTLPDGSYLQYTYDGAHRLTQINDSINNKIVYTLDAMGNRTKEEAYDPSNTLARTRQQVYDSLNRLHQSVGAQ